MVDEYSKLRDAAADAYGKKDIENNPNGYHVSDYCNDWVLPAAFEAGADWATAHWLEQVRGLVFALEVYALTNETFPEYGTVAREALAKWAELTKQNETKE